MNDQAIDQIKEALREMVQLLVQRGQPLTDELKLALSQAMEHAASRIQQLRQEDIQREQEEQQPFGGQPTPPQPEPQGIGAPPSPDAQLLFLLAGSREDVFLQYLQEYSTPETQALLSNPTELERVVQFLHAMMPSGQQPVVNGMQHTDLNSSTIWGTQYDPSTKKMKVRFQGGAEYEYDGVPTNIYRAFSQGNATASTNGQNDYGRWWRGKNPSMGAAMNQYIKQGNFPYRRLN
jgi:hypothetical protein